MKPIAFAALLAGFGLSTTGAFACANLNEAMAEFNKVKDAYVAKAPTLKPEQFQVWAKHIQGFSTAMGQMDYAGACNSLAMASTELGLGIAAAPAAPPPATDATAATPPPPPSGSTDSSATPPPPPAAASTAVAPPQPPTEAPATNAPTTPPPSTPPTTASNETSGWTECPRGRCR